MQNRLKVDGSKKQFIFRGEKASTVDEWRKAIIRENPKQPKAQFELNDNFFWKVQHMPEKTLRRTAEPGDILLFTAKFFMSGVQRFITNSKYDHVGILVRDAKGRLQLFEATADGVYNIL